MNKSLETKLYLIVFSFCLVLFTSDALTVEIVNNKQAIAEKIQQIAEASLAEKGELEEQLALLYLKDQDQERAFEVFLHALDHRQERQPCDKTPLYDEALALYFEGATEDPKAVAVKIIEKYGSIVKKQSQEFLVSYIVALAYANLDRYEEFFPLFYHAYQHCPDSFLADKTKAILHLKLMERRHTEQQRASERKAVVDNLQRALEKGPSDVTLYKMLILFSPVDQRQEQIRQCLNKIIDNNIIIPRSEILFYVKEALATDQQLLACRFLERAHQWYPKSKMVDAAQQYFEDRK